MGNCQAAEAAAVLLQHPGNVKVERMYWSISAQEVMSSNPGHYVALVLPPSSTTTSINNNNNNNNINVNTNNVHCSLKLLRPTDTLHLGQLYRLITFEDVIKEFAAKKSAKLGKLLKESGALTVRSRQKSDSTRSKLDHNNNNQIVEEEGIESGNSRSTSSTRVPRHHLSGVQWKPALQTITELET